MKDEDKSKNHLLQELNSIKSQHAELTKKLNEQAERLAELKKSNKSFHFLFEFAPDAYYVMDLQGNFVECNEAAAKLFNCCPKELHGKNFFDLNINPSQKAVENGSSSKDAKPLLGSEPQEYILTRIDGTSISLEIHSQKVKINGESVILGLARDINHRKVSEKEEEKHREFLEQLIRERTANLMATNTRLQREIRDREYRENALRESEERYKELVEKAGIGILIDDEQGNLQFFNKKLAEFFGYTVGEMKQNNILDMIHPDDLEKVLHYHKRRYLGIEVESMYEFRGVQKDGSIRYLEVHASEIRSKGKITGTRSFIWDHTEKKLAEETHRKTEQRYHELFTNMRDAAAVFDLQGRIIEFNPGFEDMSGYSAEEIARLTNKDVTPPVWYRYEEKIIKQQVFKKGYSELYQKELKRKDGSCFPVELRTYLIRNEQNEVEGTWAIIRDISERKRIEKEMRMLAHAMKSIRECVIVTDLDEQILFVNEAFAKTYGYHIDELYGKKIDILRAPGNVDEVVNKILPETLREGWEGELLNRRKNGEVFPIYLSTSVIHDEYNEPIAFVGVAADITERKKIEDQLRQAQKMDAIGKLAGGIAHDFNNILSVINGYTEMAMRELSIDQSLYRKLKQVSIAGEKAANLVRQLLAFSRKQVIEPKIVDLNQLILDLNKILMRLIGEDIEMVVALDEKAGLIKADPSQLEQVLVNLVVNARDAINQKTAIASEKKIIITTQNVQRDKKPEDKRSGKENGKQVLISVSDTGIGIDEQTRDQIFEPFFTTKAEGRGTGLGLSTVYGIVKQNNAGIELESKIGQGSTFKILWPVVESELPLTVSEKKNERVRGGKETILIVEDENQVRAVASEVLESIGYQIFEAANGIEAMAMLEKKNFQFDLVITDVIMPGMGGQELAENILKIKPDFKILFTSGYTDHKIDKSGRLINGANFLHKPYSISDLSQKVRELIEN